MFFLCCNLIFRTQAVCDCTFYHENYLTERNFKEETAERDVRQMVSLFDAVASLCASVDKDSSSSNSSKSSLGHSPLHSVVNVLGEEFAECLPWRQGSIIYAFLNCKINADASWLDGNQATFFNLLNEAINHFQLMLTIRRTENVIELEEDEEVPVELEPDLALELEELLDHSKEEALAPLDEQKIEAMRRGLLAKQHQLGEQGQELEHLQEMLEHQQEINQEALLDIQQQLQQQPQLEEVLQEVQMEVQQQQQEVLDQQEDQIEKRDELQDRMHQIQLQQQHLQALMKQLNDRRKKMQSEKRKRRTSSCSKSDPNSLKLIELGIFSDPHLLATIYTAEMAFWYSSYAEQWSFFEQNDEREKELSNLAKSMLKVYIDAVENCGLKAVGWSSERALELVEFFESTSEEV